MAAIFWFKDDDGKDQVQFVLEHLANADCEKQILIETIRGQVGVLLIILKNSIVHKSRTRTVFVKRSPVEELCLDTHVSH